MPVTPSTSIHGSVDKSNDSQAERQKRVLRAAVKIVDNYHGEAFDVVDVKKAMEEFATGHNLKKAVKPGETHNGLSMFESLRKWMYNKSIDYEEVKKRGKAAIDSQHLREIDYGSNSEHDAKDEADLTYQGHESANFLVVEDIAMHKSDGASVLEHNRQAENSVLQPENPLPNQGPVEAIKLRDHGDKADEERMRARKKQKTVTANEKQAFQSSHGAPPMALMPPPGRLNQGVLQKPEISYISDRVVRDGDSLFFNQASPMRKSVVLSHQMSRFLLRPDSDDGEDEMYWSHKKIANRMTKIMGCMMESVGDLFRSFSLDPNEKTNVYEHNPGPELQKLYEAVLGGSGWRNRAVEFQDSRVVGARLRPYRFFLSLLGRSIYENILDGKLPWPTARKLISLHESSVRSTAQVLKQIKVGSVLEFYNKVVADRLEDTEFQKNELPKHASDLAARFKLITAPHIDRLGTIPAELQAGDEIDRASKHRWESGLVTIFEEVLKLKTHLEAAADDYYLTWYSYGTRHNPFTMQELMSCKAEETMVTMTVFPGILVSETFHGQRKTNVCNKAIVMVEPTASGTAVFGK